LLWCTAASLRFAHHGFGCVVRLGTAATTPAAVNARTIGLLSALRVMESAGVRFTTPSIALVKLVGDPQNGFVPRRDGYGLRRGEHVRRGHIG